MRAPLPSPRDGEERSASRKTERSPAMIPSSSPIAMLEAPPLRRCSASPLPLYLTATDEGEGRRVEIVEADRTSMLPPLTRRDERFREGNDERERRTT
nr:hypothetical protein Iba_chr09cCG10610 [Ipomoea batatas]